MEILPIYSCFHPIMKEIAEPVIEINADIVKLAQNMIATMHATDGVGLAGNQVGSDLSIVTIDTSAFQEVKSIYKDIVLINPVITEYSDDLTDYQEGCLSVPTIHEVVKRPGTITVKFYDLGGNEQTITDDDKFARVAQHEIDHLSGKLFFDLVSPMRRTLIKSKLKKIQKGAILPEYKFVNQYDEVL